MCLKIKQLFLSAEYQPENKKGFKHEYTDVIVFLNNGEKYIASFFAFENFEKLRKEFEASGEFLGGKYFFTNNMVLIDECTRLSISQVTKHMLDEGDFKSAFRLISSGKPNSVND